MSRLLESAETSYPNFFSYQPVSLVTDHSAIDLDLSYIQKKLDHATKSKMKDAEAVYREGGFSGAYAEIEITGGFGAWTFIPKGTSVVADKVVEEEGQALGGMVIPNTLLGETMDDIQIAESKIRIAYTALPEIQNQYLKCDVGALELENQQEVTFGCFDATGLIEFENFGKYNYSYNVMEENKNHRTLQKFSSDAENEMLMCGKNCPYRTFEKYFNYYEIPDYGDRFVTSAFRHAHARYVRGNADFSSYPVDALKEAVMDGILHLNLWMHVVQKMDKAVDFCVKGETDNSVHYWDQSVAMFAGSMTLKDETGYLFFNFASRICIDFKRCSIGTVSDDSVLGRLFKKFSQGQSEILKDRANCDSARKIKESIEDLMTIPLVQGLLRSAYIRGRQQDTPIAQAKGATFAAAVLPHVHHCSSSDADIIYNEMKTGSATPDFGAVKQALERNYHCMKISCTDVGGYYDTDAKKYYPGAEPCTFAANSIADVARGGSLAVDIVVAVILVSVVFTLGMYFVFSLGRKQRKSQTGFERDQNIRDAIMEVKPPPSSFFKSRSIV
mmetsp:Transcript_1290/g.1956  ORF Transcript_1290/g.1956 Transcript_1290/m.1956 type:complete len:557 (+) Transcript_1290:50-1720(+)|eukprot:CAMPEP_0194204154 /NCGR_PEP_ID=MMETSP0156-20130528/3761_1 /TAXON_ID=33649 /ORGANISM="Thalassionema nitzschioides, Strain L26-B" /LENGTH=556 /DNA_ID=CAMNT_0038930103 /DNA_START=24 /DNA_END=1694 /DNA_ORIENTATION=-